MTSLKNHFLIAMPSLQDPHFKRSVTYICEHDENGAMGIVINKPSNMTLKEVLNQVDESIVVTEEKSDLRVVLGGPVSPDRGFIVHSPQPGWSASIDVTDDITVTTSKDILAVLGNDKSPKDILVALGYSGWEPGQLEEELKDNSWLAIEANTSLMFDTPLADRWQVALKTLGIEIHQLTPSGGCA